MAGARLVTPSALLLTYIKMHLHSIVECSRLMKGMRMGGVKIMRRMCPSRKSELHRVISTIFTMNSRAGCDIAEEPNPRPYHFPVHHALFVSSCLNSRVKKTEIRIFWIARWIATIVMRPRTAWETSQVSRYHWWKKLGHIHSWRINGTHEKLKESNQSNKAYCMGQSSNEGSKVWPSVHHRAQE